LGEGYKGVCFTGGGLTAVIWLVGADKATRRDFALQLKKDIPTLQLIDETLLHDLNADYDAVKPHVMLASLARALSGMGVPVCVYDGYEKHDDVKQKMKATEIVVDLTDGNIDNHRERISEFLNSKVVKPFIVITGEPRSGTSFLVRALNLCGMYLGGLAEMQSSEVLPNSSNLRGAWESRTLHEVNFFQEGELTEKQKKALNDLINRLISRPALATGLKLIVKKLPDTLHLLPANTIIVGVFRHPLKVAESRVRAYGSSAGDYERWIRRWKVNNERLLDILSRHGGFLINFDWPKEKLLSEINYVAERIGLVPINLETWYSEELRHSDKTYREIPLPEDILATYERLCERAERNHEVVLNIPPYAIHPYWREIVRTLLEENAEMGRAVYDFMRERARGFYQEYDRVYGVMAAGGVFYKMVAKAVDLHIRLKRGRFKRLYRRLLKIMRPIALNVLKPKP